MSAWQSKEEGADSITIVCTISEGRVINNGDMFSDSGLAEECHEGQEILNSIAECIHGLFRVSILIRKATPRDRFAKASNNPKEPFSTHFDIMHVEQKFPRLQADEFLWLRERLGFANAQRRQYLNYCRNHHGKLNYDQMFEDGASEGIDADLPHLPGFGMRRTNQGTTNTVALSSTIASTLLPEAVPEISQELSEDEQSQATSFVTSIGEEKEPGALILPSLKSIRKGKSNFECPLCWEVITIKTERKWKFVRHAQAPWI
jgi:hypothetical protein